MNDDLGEISLLHFQLKSLILQLQELEKRRKALQPGHWRPNLDIVESTEIIRFIFEVPGVRKEDISAEISNNVLIVQGGKKLPETTDVGHNFICMERQFGTFSYEIALDSGLDLEAAAAEMKNGELHITIPKLIKRRNQALRLKIHG